MSRTTGRTVVAVIAGLGSAGALVLGAAVIDLVRTSQRGVGLALIAFAVGSAVWLYDWVTEKPKP